MAVQNAERVLHGIIDIGGFARDLRVAPDIWLRRRQQQADGGGVAGAGGDDELGAGHQPLSIGLRPTIAQAGQ